MWRCCLFSRVCVGWFLVGGHEKSRRDAGSAGMSTVSGQGRWLPCRGREFSRPRRAIAFPVAGYCLGISGKSLPREPGGDLPVSGDLPAAGGGMSRDCRDAALSPPGGCPVVNGVLPRHCREAALPGELLRRVDVGGVRGHAVAAPAGEDVHVQVGH
ncbi:MAG: hypothetical protein SOY65_11030 [Marinifilaceae bacterium]|nr:hypothetical protein [Marinifilaceae bacterium]